MNRRYTEEKEAWLAERYPTDAKVPHLCEEFERLFGAPMTKGKMHYWASRRGIRRQRASLEWTDEMNAFMRGFVPGHTEPEIRGAFAERFGIVLTESQIGNAKTRLGVRSGTHGGRFEKGGEPANKGRPISEWMSPESIARCAEGRFKKGNVPHSAEGKPVGYERVTKDGYTEVKVADRPSRTDRNDNFKMKHWLVWEEAHGEPVPPHTVIVFSDGDKRNFEPSNLVAVPRRLWSIISRQKIPYADPDTLRAAMRVAEARSAISGAMKRPRECGCCGEVFAPRFAHQRTCDSCLGRC